jgi:hypothetical protein
MHSLFWFNFLKLRHVLEFIGFRKKIDFINYLFFSIIFYKILIALKFIYYLNVLGRVLNAPKGIKMKKKLILLLLVFIPFALNSQNLAEEEDELNLFTHSVGSGSAPSTGGGYGFRRN